MNRNITHLIILVILAALPLAGRAQQETYNYSQAMQALENDNYKLAMSYLYKDLKNNPQNGMSWAMLSGIYGVQNNADSAIIAIDKAIKFTPKANEELLVKCYKAKASFMEDLGMPDQQLKTLNEAVKQLPRNINMYKLRASFYENNDQMDKAIADYKKILTFDPDNLDIMSEIGISVFGQDKIDESLKWFNKALAIDQSHEKARFGKALVHFKKDEVDLALDELIQLIKTNDNFQVKKLMVTLADSAEIRDNVVNKLTACSQAEPQQTTWLTMLGSIHSTEKHYDLARQYFQKAYDISKTADIATEMSRQYYIENKYPQAAKWAGDAIQLARDSNETNDNIASRITFLGEIKFDQGNYPEAIKTFTQSIIEANDNANALFLRAQAYIFSGKEKEAMTDLNEAIQKATGGSELPYMWRGWLLNKLGKRLEAQGDFRNAIEQDSIPYPAAPTFISQHFLGIDEIAKLSAQTYLDNSTNKSAHVEVACLYALLGDKPMAVHHIELAIEKGFNSWAYLRNHPWLKPLRGYPDYDKLIKQYAK